MSSICSIFSLSSAKMSGVESSGLSNSVSGMKNRMVTNVIPLIIALAQRHQRQPLSLATYPLSYKYAKLSMRYSLAIRRYILDLRWELCESY